MFLCSPIFRWMAKMRYRLLILLLIFTLAYIYAQYRMLQIFALTPVSSVALTRDYVMQQSFVNARDFVGTCTEAGVDVVLFEPTILQTIVSGIKTNNSCRFLCRNEPTTFAVLESNWNWRVPDKLRDSGFEIMQVDATDPRSLSKLNEKIPVHYIFWRKSHLIHLVILYHRNNFYWFSKARFNSDQRHFLRMMNFDASRLKFGEFDGAISIFQLSHVKIDNVFLIAPRYPKKLLSDIQQSQFIECNYSRANHFHDVYVRDISQQAQLFRSKVKNILSRAKTVLDDLKIPFWLSSGTCLGWYRQCDIIPYSLDVDIGVRIENYRAEIISNFESSGFHLHYKFGKLTDSLQMAFTLDKVKLDIYFFYSDPPFMWNGGTHARTGKKYKFLFPEFHLCWTYFLNMLLRVPCETESYIEANYGKKWFDPVSKWEWKENPTNIRDNGEWKADQWDDVIQLFE